MTSPQTLRLCHLYPDEMNTYADRGNIAVLKHRLKWRDLDISIQELGLGETLTIQDAKNIDLFYMGGGQDMNQIGVAADLLKTKAEALKEVLTEPSNPAVGLFICGGYQLAGHIYTTATQQLQGLGILDVRTEHNDEKRLVGNIKIAATIENTSLEIIGYENHAGRSYLEGSNASVPFGKVIDGSGNNGSDKTEGAIRAHTIGTYIHGPLLPKNPDLADLLINWGLQHHYSSEAPELSKLDDSFAEQARAVLF